MSETLKGRLLLSSAALHDPNFRHTVVLLGEHDPTGAVGVVLTRPLETSVAEAAPALAELVPAGAPLFEGGPVDRESAVLLAELDDPDLLDVPVFGSVGFLTGDVDRAIRSSLVRARVFIGHAGWGAGQLEGEMAEEAWIVEDPKAEEVFTDDPEGLWHRILERKGPPWSTMARVPFDPTTN